MYHRPLNERTYTPSVSVLVLLAACQMAECKEQSAAAVSIASVDTLLAGRYDNSAQVTDGKSGKPPAPQHVIITIEPTQHADWELWRVHMEVDPAVAQLAVDLVANDPETMPFGNPADLLDVLGRSHNADSAAAVYPFGVPKPMQQRP